VAAHGGREIKTTGEGLMVAFASAAAAVRCAIDMRRSSSNAATGLALRIGLDAGEPLPDGGDLYGSAVTLASRLCDAAAEGQILASDAVRHIAAPHISAEMEPAGALRLAGITEPVRATEVNWRGTPSQQPPPQSEVPVHQISVVIADDQRLLRTGFR
jgi:class 3 adenylate cyclase